MFKRKTPTSIDKKILIIDDNKSDAYLISEILDIDLNHVTTLKDGVSRLKHEDFDLVLCDLSLTDSFGFGCIDELKDYAPVVCISGIGNGMADKLAKERGALGFINKDNTKGLMEIINE